MAKVPSWKRASKMPVGTGARFRAVSSSVASRGARNPNALAAYIGRRKYGSKGFAKLSAGGKRRKK